MNNNEIIDSIITIVENEGKDIHSSFDADEIGEMLVYLKNLKSNID